MNKILKISAFTAFVCILIEYYFGLEYNVLFLALIGFFYIAYKDKYFIIGAATIILISLSLFLYNYNYISFDPGTELSVEGEILKAYERHDEYQRIEILSNTVNGKKFKSKFSVATYSNLQYELGNYVSLTGVVEEIHGNKNFGLQNLKDLQRIRGISNSISTDRIDAYSNNSIILRFKRNIIDGVENSFDQYLNTTNSGIMKKLFLADSKYIDEESQEIYSEAGLAHILAVSGLHIMIIIYMLNFIMEKLSIGFNLKAFISILILLLYGFIIDFPPSVSRAIIMYTIMILSESMEIKMSNISRLLWAFLILIFINPYNVFDIGFQLSFMALVGLFYFKELLFPQIPSNLMDLVQSYVSVNLAIFPILALNFNNYNPISLITNILMTPIITIIMFLGITSLLLEMIIGVYAFVLFSVLDFVLSVSNFYLKYLVEVFGFNFTIKYPSYLFLAVYYLLLFSFTSRDLRQILYEKKNVIYIMFFIMFLTQLINLNRSILYVGFYDVGQGDSSYIVYKNLYIQIDTGGTGFGSYNPGVEVTKRAIDRRGIKKIDLMILSHMDMDHVGGVSALLEDGKVSNIFIKDSEKESEIFDEVIFEESLEIIYLLEDTELRIDDDLSIKFLNTEKSQNQNDNSLVCLIEFKNHKILYTGDIGSVMEEGIGKKIGGVDILKVSHHGSESSTSMEFLNTIRPKYSVISVGKNNYGHPSPNVLENLSNVNSRILRTDREGEILFSIGNNVDYITYENRNISIFIIIYTLISVIIEGSFIKYLLNRGDNNEIQ